MRTMALLVCALAFALLGAGCGDDDSETTTSDGATAGATTGETGSAGDESDDADSGSGEAGGGELSSEEFVGEATAICKEASKQFQAEFRAIADRGKQQGGNPREALGEAVTKAFNTELDRIGALSVPEGDEDQVEAILNALRKATEEIEANPSGLQQAGAQVNKASNLASKYGLKGCPLGN